MDTPGFNDSERSDTEILELIAEWLQGSYKEARLSGIIYLYDISAARMTGACLQNLRLFRRLCGDKFLKNVILATTKWNITPIDDAKRRDEELHQEDGFWGPMMLNGSRIREFTDTEGSAKALVREMIDMGDTRNVPKMQSEIVNGKALAETEAGAFIEERLTKLKRRHSEEQKALKEEMRVAKQERKPEINPTRVQHVR